MDIEDERRAKRREAKAKRENARREGLIVAATADVQERRDKTTKPGQSFPYWRNRDVFAQAWDRLEADAARIAARAAKPGAR